MRGGFWRELLLSNKPTAPSILVGSLRTRIWYAYVVLVLFHGCIVKLSDTADEMRLLISRRVWKRFLPIDLDYAPFLPPGKFDFILVKVCAEFGIESIVVIVVVAAVLGAVF